MASRRLTDFIPGVGYKLDAHATQQALNNMRSEPCRHDSQEGFTTGWGGGMLCMVCERVVEWDLPSHG